MKKTLLTLSMAAALSVSTPAVYASDNTEDAINYRQGVFTAIKWHFGNLSDQVRGKADYDKEAFETRADKLKALAGMVKEGFVSGSYSDDSNALPAIESNAADFDLLMADFEEKAGALADAAKTANMNLINQAFGDAARTCKGCHDSYKK
jgi:cytochrome c556